MGKKDSNKRKRVDEAETEEVDPELQAEIAAVLASRSERLPSEATESTKVKTNIYNKEGLENSLENIDTVDLPFEETMQICEYDIAIQNENDDIEREMAFYNHTLLAVKSGREKLHLLGIPTRRPNDYFCENVKTDAHMAKIKDRLLIEEKRIEAFELRKNREQNRKFNKQVSELRKQEKVQDRKAHNEEVSRIRKSDDKGDKESRINKIIGDKQQPAKKSFKREGLDKKYSFGAKDRKMAKMTDKKSLNDMSDFNPRGGKFVRRDKAGARGGANGGKGASGSRSSGGGGSETSSFKRGRGGGGADKKKGGNRPGKEARAQKRASKG